MNFFDQMYVGFQRDRYQKSDEPRLLGFAVKYDKTKASKDRQNTVDRWRQKDIEPRIIENKPARGFKIIEFVTRYSTSNKLFRVLDPRGFELEISAENLVELMLTSIIVKGEIIDECVWASKSKNYLISTSSEEYKQHTAVKKTGPTKIEQGKYYEAVGNTVSLFRFEGIYHNTYLNVMHTATKADITREEMLGRPYYNNNPQYVISVAEYDTDVEILLNTGQKPSYVYTEFRLDSEGNIKGKGIITVRKSHFKDLIECTNDELISQAPLFDESELSEDIDKADNKLHTHITLPYSGFFKTKDEARKFDYSKIIEQIKPSMNSYYYGISGINVSKFTSEMNSYYSRYTKRLNHDVKQNINITDNRR